MRKLVLLLISCSVAVLLVAGMALAATKRCPDTNINDDCRGTQNDDTLIGNQSFENIYGLGGDDRIEGRGDLDSLYGGGGDDKLLGGYGGDLLYPGPGNDTLFGGPYGDLYVFDAGWEKDTIVDGAQDDRNYNEVKIDESVTSGVFVNLTRSSSRAEVRTADGGNTINWASDTIVQNMSSNGRGNDVIRGTNGANSIESQDFEEPYTSADEVYALGGNDFVSVVDVDGEDFVDCGEGNDTVYYSPGDEFRNCEAQEEIDF